MQLEILKNRLALQIRKPTGCRYGDNIKKFDFTFNYHSPKAYEFCPLASTILLLGVILTASAKRNPSIAKKKV